MQELRRTYLEIFGLDATPAIRVERLQTEEAKLVITGQSPTGQRDNRCCTHRPLGSLQSILASTTLLSVENTCIVGCLRFRT
jgi:hypothetical protein